MKGVIYKWKSGEDCVKIKPRDQDRVLDWVVRAVRGLAGLL